MADDADPTEVVDPQMEAMIAETHRAMLDPAFQPGASKQVRKIKYGGAPLGGAEDNRWWLQDAGVPAASTPAEQPGASEADARSAIESEPAFQSAFLMGFGDPSRMVQELVVLNNYDHRGQVVKDSGAYIGAEGRKVGQLETFKPKPFAQAKKGSAAVSYDIKEPPPHEQKGPKRVDSRRPASARRRSAPKEAWGAAGVGGAGRRDERQMTAAVAAAFGAMRRAQLRELEQQQRQASSSPGSGGARGFAGNPRNQRGRAAGPAAADGSSRRPQLEHGPVGRFIPPAPPVIVRSAELADSERPRTSGGAEAAAQPGGARRPSSAHARRASGASTARVQVDRVAWARERHEQSMRERHRPQTARTNRAAYDPWATGRRAPDSLRGPPSPAHAGAERAAELDAADIARRRASNAPATMEAARAGGGRLTRGAAFGGGRAGSGGGREPSELMLELLDL